MRIYSSIAYVNDASYYAEGSNFVEVYNRLHNMMHRDQGGYDWPEQHKLCFKLSKMALMGFSHK